MDIRLLGDVEIESAGTTFTLERSAERCVLATLAFSTGHVVAVGTLVDHIWSDRPTTNAEQTVASYVRTVRRVIERAGGGRDWLPNRRFDGYRLDIDPAMVDHRRFTDLSSTARHLASRADHARAIEAYERALGLWRGEALANVAGRWADGRRYRMRQERLAVTFELLDLLLRRGAYETVAGRAVDLVLEEPSDRALALALRGLAGSGQKALIQPFLNRAAERMREVGGGRPSAEVVALARKLTDSPVGDELPFRGRQDDVITMTATNAKNIYQASGDQYFID